MRCQYSADQILSEILRDDLHSSHNSDENELFDVASDSDVGCSVDVAVDDVTGCDDVTVESVNVDSEDSDPMVLRHPWIGHLRNCRDIIIIIIIDYEPAEDLDHDTSPCDNNIDDGVMSDNGGGIDVDDGTDVMWSRCGSVSWKSHAPTSYHEASSLAHWDSPQKPQVAIPRNAAGLSTRNLLQ